MSDENPAPDAASRDRETLPLQREEAVGAAAPVGNDEDVAALAAEKERFLARYRRAGVLGLEEAVASGRVKVKGESGGHGDFRHKTGR